MLRFYCEKFLSLFSDVLDFKITSRMSVAVLTSNKKLGYGKAERGAEIAR